VPDNTSIALLSDWGTGNFGAGDAPSVKISKLVPSLKPTYTTHLGDVYYAGQSSEETGNFLSWWPQGTSASFALNSNHDMYSGGEPYFDRVVGGPIFNKLQSPWSFFALESSHWLVIGLDSAYFSSELGLYLNGTLGQDNAQTQFLKMMAQCAGMTGRKVIILTHHNPIPVGGVPAQDPPAPLQLYTDVMEAFANQPTGTSATNTSVPPMLRFRIAACAAAALATAHCPGVNPPTWPTPRQPALWSGLKIASPTTLPTRCACTTALSSWSLMVPASQSTFTTKQEPSPGVPVHEDCGGSLEQSRCGRSNGSRHLQGRHRSSSRLWTDCVELPR
jgi:hypothetical protein